MVKKEDLKRAAEKSSLRRPYYSTRKAESETPHPNLWRRFLEVANGVPATEDTLLGKIPASGEYSDVMHHLANADNYMDRVSAYLDGKRPKIWGGEIWDAVNSYNYAMGIVKNEYDNSAMERQIYNRALKQFRRVFKKSEKSDIKRLEKLPQLEDVLGALNEPEEVQSKGKITATVFLGLSVLSIGAVFMKPTGAVIGVKTSNIFGALAIIFLFAALYFVLRNRKNKTNDKNKIRKRKKR